MTIPDKLKAGDQVVLLSPLWENPARTVGRCRTTVTRLGAERHTLPPLRRQLWPILRERTREVVRYPRSPFRPFGKSPLLQPGRIRRHPPVALSGRTGHTGSPQMAHRIQRHHRPARPLEPVGHRLAARPHGPTPERRAGPRPGNRILETTPVRGERFIRPSSTPGKQARHRHRQARRRKPLRPIRATGNPLRIPVGKGHPLYRRYRRTGLPHRTDVVQPQIRRNLRQTLRPDCGPVHRLSGRPPAGTYPVPGRRRTDAGIRLSRTVQLPDRTRQREPAPPHRDGGHIDRNRRRRREVNLPAACRIIPFIGINPKINCYFVIEKKINPHENVPRHTPICPFMRLRKQYPRHPNRKPPPKKSRCSSPFSTQTAPTATSSAR